MIFCAALMGGILKKLLVPGNGFVQGFVGSEGVFGENYFSKNPSLERST
jgi:hypothetical protein